MMNVQIYTSMGIGALYEYQCAAFLIIPGQIVLRSVISLSTSIDMHHLVSIYSQYNANKVIFIFNLIMIFLKIYLAYRGGWKKKT